MRPTTPWLALFACVAIACSSPDRSLQAPASGGPLDTSGSTSPCAACADPFEVATPPLCACASGNQNSSGLSAAGTQAATAGSGAWDGDESAPETAGMGGTVAADAFAQDAGADASTTASTDPCPPSFECVTDPLIMMLSVCLKSGAVPTPVSCMSDAECIAAGLPKGICAQEEETGLTGCVQICTP